MQATVDAAYPLSVTTPTISLVVQNHFGLTFEMPAEHKERGHVSILGSLNNLRRLGLIEHLHDPQGYKSEVGQLGAIPPNAKTNDLVKFAIQAGTPLTSFAEESPAPPDGPEEDDLPR